MDADLDVDVECDAGAAIVELLLLLPLLLCPHPAADSCVNGVLRRLSSPPPPCNARTAAATSPRCSLGTRLQNVFNAPQADTMAPPGLTWHSIRRLPVCVFFLRGYCNVGLIIYVILGGGGKQINTYSSKYIKLVTPLILAFSYDNANSAPLFYYNRPHGCAHEDRLCLVCTFKSCLDILCSWYNLKNDSSILFLDFYACLIFARYIHSFIHTSHSFSILLLTPPAFVIVGIMRRAISEAPPAG